MSLPETPAFWSEDAEAAAHRIGAGPGGLTAAEAARRLAEFGPNLTSPPQSSGWLRLLARQFESPLVLILVFAAAVSLVLRQWVDAGIVMAIVLGSSALSFSQEYGASRAVEELRARLRLTALALRDGRETQVPVGDLVPGDVVRLSAGNLVPADGLILAASDFQVSEAALTGETFPVEKRPGVTAADALPAARWNAVFLGTSVRSGQASVLILRTGKATEFGAIAQRLRARPPETDFERGVRQFGMLLMRVMVVIVLFVLTMNLLLGRPVVDSLLFAVALAVGLSPELLPGIISVTLSAGAREMGRRGVIVRRLEAIENLGSMTVLCTDKTGTLTQGLVVLRAATDAAGAESAEVMRLAWLNAALETGIANPLDAAITAAGKDRGLEAAGWEKRGEIPYDFVRRRLTIFGTDAAGQGQMITKGAVSEVLDICTTWQKGGQTAPLDAAARAGLEAYFRRQGEEGCRVLALATRDLPAGAAPDRAAEREMTFRGFLIFLDPPKEDAGQTIADLARLGIAIKVISGDNRHVTAHLARGIGLDPASLLTGREIAAMKDEALWHMAPRTSLFVEIDPQQKERIVRALQRTGHSVGYMGDGINDAPALHAADVGISVEGAVDVARESADIILLRPDLSVLKTGVEDGRKTFANTLKYISITTSANFGNMISMALAAPFLPFLPLLAKQILLNNFLSDLPSTAISGDRVDAGMLTQPQRWNMGEIQRFMVVFGLVSSVFDLVTFALLLTVFHAPTATFQTAWFLISLLTEIAVVLVLRTRGWCWQTAPSPLLLWSSLVVGLGALALPFLPPVAALFGFVPLSPALMATALAIVSGYIATTELVKRRFWRPRG